MAKLMSFVALRKYVIVRAFHSSPLKGIEELVFISMGGTCWMQSKRLQFFTDFLLCMFLWIKKNCVLVKKCFLSN